MNTPRPDPPAPLATTCEEQSVLRTSPSILACEPVPEHEGDGTPQPSEAPLPAEQKARPNIYDGKLHLGERKTKRNHTSSTRVVVWTRHRLGDRKAKQSGNSGCAGREATSSPAAGSVGVHRRHRLGDRKAQHSGNSGSACDDAPGAHRIGGACGPPAQVVEQNDDVSSTASQQGCGNSAEQSNSVIRSHPSWEPDASLSSGVPMFPEDAPTTSGRLASYEAAPNMSGPAPDPSFRLSVASRIDLPLAEPMDPLVAQQYEARLSLKRREHKRRRRMIGMVVAGLVFLSALPCASTFFGTGRTTSQWTPFLPMKTYRQRKRC